VSHSLDDVRREYDRLDALCGADSRGIELKVSTRMSRCLGKCTMRGGRPVRITIAAHVMASENEETFWDTVRHEYAHALVKLRRPREDHAHDAVWKSACREVGCRPKARCPADEAADAAQRGSAKYRLTCRACGAAWYYQRRTKAIAAVQAGYGGRYRCPNCRGNAFLVQTLRP